MSDASDRQQPTGPVSIPDGGLASALPDWMQVKPGWTDRADRSSPQVVRERTVPAPETSPILLADILTTDDLPGWLQDVARRSDQTTATAEESSPVEVDPALVETAAGTVPPDPETTNQPWWASDRMMAGLLIAVILTLFFVLYTTIRLM